MKIKHIVSLTLCFTMAAGLVACKNNAEVSVVDPSARSDGKVYVESRMEMELGEKEVRNMCMMPDGNFFAITANPANDYKPEVCLLDAEGKLLSTHALDKSISNLDRMCLGLDGKVYVAETRYEMQEMSAAEPGDAPDPNATPAPEASPTPEETPKASPTSTPEETPADAKADEAQAAEPEPAEAADAGSGARMTMMGRENYTPPKMTMFVHRFNPQGELEASVEIKVPEDKGSDTYIRALQADAQGKLYISMGMAGLMGFSADGSFERSYAFENVEGIVLLPGGDAVVLSYGMNGAGTQRISLETGAQKVEFSAVGFFERLMYNPADGHAYAYTNGIVTRLEDDGTTSDILHLSDYSLMSPLLQMEDFAFGEHERLIFIMTRRPSEYERMLSQLNQTNIQWGAREVITLSLADSADVPKRKTITVSVMSSDYMITQAASAFQSLHPDIAVKVREIVPREDIGEGGIDAYNAYLKKVNTEILTGKAADIIALSNLPYKQYQDKKILLDLSGYIKNDPELNDSDYFMNVIKAFETGGKQYVLPTNFNASAFMVRDDYGVPDTGFSLKEFVAFCDALPEGKVPLGRAASSEIFDTLMLCNLDYFLDTETKQARLDTPEFIELLEAAKRMGKRGEAFKIDENDPTSWQQYNAFARENVVFFQMGIYDYNLQQQMLWEMGAAGKLIPLPGIEGPGRFFSTWGQYGINRSAKDKDACWEFLRFMISEDYLKMSTYGQITINKKVNRQISDLRIELDKTGQSSGMMSDGVREMEVPKLTQADVDTVNAFLEKLERPVDYDSKFMDVMREEVALFFEGTKDAQSVASTLQSRMGMYLSE